MRDRDPIERWRRDVRRAIAGADDDLVEEIAQHVSARWQSAKAEGLDDEAADALVRRDLDQWRSTPAPRRVPPRPSVTVGWAADLRAAVRALRARPVVTVAGAVLTTLAVAATTAAFAIAYGILWRPLSYPDSDRLAVLWQVHRGTQGQVAYPDFKDLAQASVFDGSAAMNGGQVSVRIGETIHRVNVLYLEAPGYAMLGARPALGRLLRASDGSQPNIMVSHRLWTTRLGADPAVVGRTLWVSGTTCTIVGVLEAGFDFELPISPALRLERHDVWRVVEPDSPFVRRRDAQVYEALVRLAPGATPAQAQGAIDGVAQRLARTHAATNAERSFRIVPLKEQIVGRVRRALLLVVASAVGALAIALANLIAVTLVRLADRRAELAVREALGAGAARLRRQLFTEHLLNAAAGAVGGFLLAHQATMRLVTSTAADLPRPDAIRFDLPVVAAAAATVTLIAVVLTLLPLGRSGSAALLRAGVRGTSRGGRRVRGALIAGELAIAVALAVGGALLGLSLVRLFAVDPGFRAQGVASLRVSAFQQRYAGLTDVDAFVGRVLDRIAAMPEVSHVAAGLSLPLSGQLTGVALQAEGRPQPLGARPEAGWQFVTAGYFAALGMPIVRGRDFTTADRAQTGDHVTIVNESLARTLFGGEDPIGRRITDGDGSAASHWHVIVGVVGDVRHVALDEAPGPRVYDLFGEHWGRTTYVVVRTQMGDPSPLLPALRRAVAEIDSEAPVFEMQTLSSLLERSAAPYWLAALLAGGLALASIVLALIGVYAVAAATVSERTREIGIRAALGAAPSALLRLVLRDAVITSLSGAVVGLGGAWVASRLLQSQLFGVHDSDVSLTLPIVATAAVVIAMAATLPVARRAARVDPVTALRAE